MCVCGAVECQYSSSFDSFEFQSIFYLLLYPLGIELVFDLIMPFTVSVGCTQLRITRVNVKSFFFYQPHFPFLCLSVIVF